MKTKKKRRSRRFRGGSTHGHGSRKKWKGSGHKGGKGMAGTGKRADQKKTLVIKLYGNKYFGKQGITSKSTFKKKNKVINLRDIEKNFDSLKKFEKDGWLDLKEYKVLGDGEINKKIKIRVLDVSERAREKIKKIGGEVEILRKTSKTISK
ncbi:MAG: uL15m family ribosomal protein [Nanoarchaeota archaeon]